MTATETTEPTDDPATDPIGTVRVHPDGSPEDPDTRRAWKVGQIDSLAWWEDGRQEWRRDEDVATWPRQPLTDVARVLGHSDTSARPDVVPDTSGLRTELDNLRRELREILGVADGANDEFLLLQVRGMVDHCLSSEPQPIGADMAAISRQVNAYNARTDRR
ncbi:hypothetical protein [Saccharopolyspora sp. NPDC002376]